MKGNQLNNKTSTPNQDRISIFRAVLGKKLLLWFLALSLIPLSVVSIISYKSACKSLREDAEKSLRVMAQLRMKYINSYFSSMFIDLQYQAEQVGNLNFLTQLHHTFEQSNKPIGEFIKSFGWEMIVHEKSGDLITFWKTYHYHDLFLIDTDGNVLFTAGRKEDLGTNLFQGKYSDTFFAAACRKSLKTGRPVFSDYEFYQPAQGAVACFLVSVLVDEDGEKTGLIALQVPIDQISQIMTENTGLGESGETYLVGEDYLMRSESRFGDGSILTRKVDTEASKSALAGKAGTRIILDYRNISVLSHFAPMHVGEVHWAMIAEIDEAEAIISATRLQYLVFGMLAGTCLIVLLITIPIAKGIVRPILILSSGASRVTDGDLEVSVDVESRNEIGDLTESFNHMTAILRKNRDLTRQRDWLKAGMVGLNDTMRGQMDVSLLSRNIVTYLAEYLGARIGVIFLSVENQHLEIAGRYAYEKHQGESDRFVFGEGIVGQAAVDGKITLISDLPDDYITIDSGLGRMLPRNIVVMPFLFENQVKGVIELGTVHQLSDLQMELLNQVGESIAIAVKVAQSGAQQRILLDETQSQAKELLNQQGELKVINKELEEQTRMLKQSGKKLQAQQEELKVSNAELEEQTQRLKQSEKRLRTQQEELEVVNEELEEKNHSLQMQKKEIEKTKNELEIQTGELATASKYKSEFLANMSHELRTPLNSLLILSKMLADNKKGNLFEDQTESAEVIYNSGISLLTLINEILDLSKIEAGRMDVNINKVSIKILADNIKNNFKHMLDKKGLSLIININKKMPEFIKSDQNRLEQIIKNLISNAVKFTKAGNVRVDFNLPSKSASLFRSGLNAGNSVSISVSDTGIGISPDKQKIIFEAFQQSDGSTSREYGGTGLGLSISRELAILLGGEIQVESYPGKGSSFTLYLPLQLERENQKMSPVPEKNVPKQKKKQVALSKPAAQLEIKDDRGTIKNNKNVILIIEDDPNFAKLVMDLCHEKDYKALVALNGESGLQLADEYLPLAIILDLHLPGINGWAVLDSLKDNPETRHIPVHIISSDNFSFEAFKKGVIGYLTKPVKEKELEAAFTVIENFNCKKIKNLLVIEDDRSLNNAIIKLIGNGDVSSKGVASGMEAMTELKSEKYDCMILDLGLPDMSGFELLDKLEEDAIHIPPVVIYTGKELNREQELELKKHAESIIIKGVRSEERLLDETSLFLHRMVDKLPEKKKKMILNLYDSDTMFSDKRVLIVDDDMRNVFAVSQLLSQKGIKILKAENGVKALKILNQEPNIDLVLMDIMMPEMDGYEAIKRIRKQECFFKLPIIALTAKAKKNDFEKCMAAGANDYLSKPVDIDRLLSMMRVWLYR